MPELPEVETCRQGIAPSLVGQEITGFHFGRKDLRWPIPIREMRNLTGKTIESVERRGKYILINVDSGYMLLHLGMSGSLRILDKGAPRKLHDHVDMYIGKSKLLRFHDPRRFGCWLYQSGKDHIHPLLEDLGPEPLTDDFNPEYLFRRTRNKNRAIKLFIMDSHEVVGVGNIYASESLFKSGILPQRNCSSLSRPETRRLVIAIKDILAYAIQRGGTTLRDFLNSDGNPGYFSQELMVYGRENEPCLACGKPVACVTLGQRSTFYCQYCQK